MVFSVAKAWRAAITPDEARTYLDLVSQPFARMLDGYDANHHVLNSLLCWVSVRLFGVSEFALRIPALLGGLLYLAVACRLSRRLFGTGWFFLVSVALLVTNPLIVDNISLARGYGMGLAFMLLVLDWMMEAVAEALPRGWTLNRIAIAAALAVASNLVYLFPCVGMLALLGATQCFNRQRTFDVVEQLLLPAVLVDFILLAIPLSHASPGSFYVGSGSLPYALETLINLSLRRAGLAPGPLDPSVAQACFGVAMAILLAALAFCVAGLIRWIKARRFHLLPQMDQFRFLAGGGMWLALLGMVAAHYGAGMPYPWGRTGLYWIPLLTLFSLALLKWRGRWRAIAVPGLSLGCLCLVQYARGFNLEAYGEWKSDSGILRVAREIRRVQPPNAKVRIRAGGGLYQSLNFYRDKYHWSDWDRAWGLPADGEADFRVFEPWEADLVSKRGLTRLYTDPQTGLVLAR
jgi:hypothetical protein